VSQIDLDNQVDFISDKARQLFGIETFSDLQDPKTLKWIIQSYLLQDQISQSGAFGSQQIALTLLSTIRYDRDRA
ncbi:flagellar protein, partial [bacterium]|nr:flagellar protein [bacterium]